MALRRILKTALTQQVNIKQKDMKKVFLIALVSVLCIPAFSQNEIKGVWLANDGNTKVKIYKKDDQHYVGQIVWLKKPTNRKGEPHKDRLNPDKSLRDRTIMGINILSDMVYKDGKWRGTIYTPKKGKTLDVVVELNQPDLLEINVSYLGFSRQKKWVRAEITE